MIHFVLAAVLTTHPNAVQVVDGDTFKLRFRLAHIDTPEITGKCKRERQLAVDAKRVTALFLARTNEVKVIGYGRYGRPLVTVRYNNTYLHQELLKRGLAVPFGIKGRWCK